MHLFSRSILLTVSIFILNIGNEQTLHGQELSMFPRGLFTEFYEDDVKLSRVEFVKKINSVPESAIHWKKFQTSNAISIVSGIGNIAGLTWWLTREESDSTTAPILTTLTTSIISAIFSKKAFKHRRDALLSYNKSAAIGSYITPSSEGIGLTLHF